MEIYDYINQSQKPAYVVPAQPQSSEFGGYVYQDLYPCDADSRFWIELFVIASNINHDLAKRLEYVRTVGAWLIFDQTFGFRLQPIVDPGGTYGWQSQEQYEREGKSQLSVYYQEVIDCLAELRRRVDQGLIR